MAEIRTRVATDEYRKGWDETFGKVTPDEAKRFEREYVLAEPEHIKPHLNGEWETATDVKALEREIRDELAGIPIQLIVKCTAEDAAEKREGELRAAADMCLCGHGEFCDKCSMTSRHDGRIDSPADFHRTIEIPSDAFKDDRGDAMLRQQVEAYERFLAVPHPQGR